MAQQKRDRERVFSQFHLGPWSQKGSVMDDLEMIEVSIVVRDLETTVKQLEEYFGMVPYYVSDVIEAAPKILYGKPSPGHKLKLALYQTGPASKVGPIRFELIQPCGGESLYQEFLDLKGQGVNHIGFSPRNGKSQDERLAWLESRGMKAICRQPSSKYSGWIDNVYYDTLGILGFFLETVEPREISE